MLSKYPKIYTIGKEEIQDLLKDESAHIVIEEKIDGANFRFMVNPEDGTLLFGSRTKELASDTDEAGGNWKRCIEYLKKIHETTPFEKGYAYYGECCTRHSMDYNWDQIPPFLLFDIMDLSTGKFVQQTSKVFMISGKLSTVPFIWGGTVKEFYGWMYNNGTKFEDDSIVPKSKYASLSAKDQKAEGIVIKDYNRQIFGKYVRAAFKELNKEVFGEGKAHFADTDDERIVAAFCTNARIDKIIFKLIDEGHKLDMPLMEHLPRRVIDDIMEENWKEISWSSWSINFKSVRKKITSRCLAVLKQMITNQALNS